MKNKITVSFCCPAKTARIIDEYCSRLGISRSACITMMCNAYIVAENRYGFGHVIVEKKEEGENNGD